MDDPKEFFNSFTEGQQQQQSQDNGDNSNGGGAGDNGEGGGEQAAPVIELNQSEGQQAQEGQQQKPIDFDAEIEKRFGVKSNDLKSKLEAISTLEAKANAKSYLSAFGEEFDKLVSPVEVGGKGLPAEIAIKYLSDTSKLGNREYKALVMKIENPTLTDSEIQDLIDLDYSLGIHAGVREGDDEDVRSEKEKIGQLKLKRDVIELRKKDQEYKAKMLEPYNGKGKIEAEESRRKQEQSEIARKETWKGKQTELLNNFKVFKIPFGEKEVVKDGNKVKEPAGWYNFEVKPEVREKIAAEVAHYIENNPQLMPDERGTQFVTDTLFKLAMYQHAMPRIAQSLIELGNSKERDFFSRELNNPQFKNESTRTFDHSQRGGNEDIYDFLLKQKTN